MKVEDYYDEEVIVDEEIVEDVEEDRFTSILSSLKEFKAISQAKKAAKERIVDDELSVASEESIYEEQVIEKWFGRDVEPDDLHAACMALLPIVYKGEDVDPEAMMRRTPLPELYKYLKQHYDYKKEVKNDVTEEEAAPVIKQMSLESLFQNRTIQIPSTNNNTRESEGLEEEVVDEVVDEEVVDEKNTFKESMLRFQSEMRNKVAGEAMDSGVTEYEEEVEEEEVVDEKDTFKESMLRFQSESGRKAAREPMNTAITEYEGEVEEEEIVDEKDAFKESMLRFQSELQENVVSESMDSAETEYEEVVEKGENFQESMASVLTFQSEYEEEVEDVLDEKDTFRESMLRFQSDIEKKVARKSLESTIALEEYEVEFEEEFEEEVDEKDYFLENMLPFKSGFEEQLIDDKKAAQESIERGLTVQSEYIKHQDSFQESLAPIEYVYEEQVVEKWYGRDLEPDDLRAACLDLIPIVYKGEDADPEAMMRRTPLPELYKYLKQHVDYKKEVKNEIDEEQETEQVVNQPTSLQTLFQNRSQQQEAAVEASEVQATAGRANVRGALQRVESEAIIEVIVDETEHDESEATMEEEIIEYSTFKLALNKMGESERTFEEIVDEEEGESLSDEVEEEIEETLHEEEEEIDEEIEETFHDEEEDVYEEEVVE
jgi:hypothetical protein